jgi:hypothetical protein
MKPISHMLLVYSLFASTVVAAVDLSAAGVEEFPTKVTAEIQATCRLSPSDTELVEKCLSDFAKNECHKLPNDPDVQGKVASCRIQDLKSQPSREASRFLEMCGQEIYQSYKDLFDLAASAPPYLLDGLKGKHLNEMRRVTQLAQGVCSERQGFSQDDATRALSEPLGSPQREKLKKWNNCVFVESSRIKGYGGKEDLLKFFGEMKKGLSCYKKAYWASMACPLISDVLLTGGVGAAAKLASKQSLKAASLPGSAAYTKTLPKVESYLDKLSAGAASPKETASVLHQRDLTDFAQSQYARQVVAQTSTNVDALMMGMLDSDVGKLSGEWKRAILSPSRQSDELLAMLKGQGSSPAARAFQEIMQENGMAGKGLLNPALSNDQLREVLQKNPILQGYLHEVPGMSRAIEDLNSGRISKIEFKERMKANLFHNGPHEGFWKLLGESFVPGALKNGDEGAKDFFKGTVFDGGKNGDGVTTAKYPGPISAEGVFHTFVDRMSQGSRGGMLKIWDELGGQAFAENPAMFMKDFPVNKMNMVPEMLVGNPTQTLKQLDALAARVKEMPQLSDVQRAAMGEMIAKGQDRLRAQLDFVNKRLQKTDNGFMVVLDASDGTKVNAFINNDTSAGDAKNLVERLMLAEEKLNGNLITGFSVAPPKKGSFYSSGVGLAAGKFVITADICEQPSRDRSRSSESTPSVR